MHCKLQLNSLLKAINVFVLFGWDAVDFHKVILVIYVHCAVHKLSQTDQSINICQGYVNKKYIEKSIL